MSNTLRIILLITAFVTTGWILFKIRKLKVKLEDAIFWIIFSGILCILAIFPGLTYWLTGMLGVMSPANLIFLIIIFLLIEKVFTLSIVVSQLEEKITVLSAEVALRTHDEKNRLEQAEKLLQQIRPQEGPVHESARQKTAGGSSPEQNESGKQNQGAVKK